MDTRRGVAVLEIIFSVISCSMGSSEKETLDILGLFPLTGKLVGVGTEPAAEIAMKMVNNNEDILPKYKLRLTSFDTECDGGVATEALYRALYADTVQYVIILGAGCSTGTQPTARTSHYWHLVQLSDTSTSPLLRDRDEFPLLYRMAQEESSLNIAKFLLMRNFGWRKVATIHENFELFSILTADFQRDAQSHCVDVVASESFSRDPSIQLQNIKRKGARIIVGHFYPTEAVTVFCEAYKLGMFGRAYVWIIIGWYAPEWWRDVSDVNCTVDQMREAVEGYFSVDADPRNRSPGTGAANLSTDGLFGMLGADPDVDTEYQYVTYAFDSMWAIALALHEADKELRLQNPPRSISEFTYDNDIYTYINRSMSGMDFLGVSGHVSFTPDGGRTGGILVEQNQNGSEIIVASFDPSGTNNSEIEWIHPVIWQGDGPPPDSPIVENLVITIPRYLFVTMTTLAIGGILLALFFLAFNLKYRHKRSIKMSSPYLNNLILIGGILAYVSILLFGIDDGLVSRGVLLWMCKGHLWTIVASFSIAYGAMFAKTWRVHRLFTNKKLQKMVIKDHRLYAMISTLVLVDIAIFLVWEMVDPLQVVEKEIHLKIDGNDVVRGSYATMCESESQSYFYGVLLSINGVLLMFGAFLAWETRHVTYKALNDSKYIGMSVYTVVVLSFVGAPVALAIDDVAVQYLLISMFIIFATTLTLSLVFIPKLKDTVSVQPEHSGTEQSMRGKPPGNPPVISNSHQMGAVTSR